MSRESSNTRLKNCSKCCKIFAACTCMQLWAVIQLPWGQGFRAVWVQCLLVVAVVRWLGGSCGRLWSVLALGAIGAGSGFRVEGRTAGKVQFLFFKSFLLVLAVLSFWRGGGGGGGGAGARRLLFFFSCVGIKPSPIGENAVGLSPG